MAFYSKYIFLLVVLTFGVPKLSLSQCLQIEVPVDYVPQRSELIMEGKVLSSTPMWNDARNYIYTIHEILPYKVVKGSLTSDRVYVATEGGQVGERLQVTSPAIELSYGDIGLFMLNELEAEINDFELGPLYNCWATDQSHYHYDQVTKKALDGFREYDLGKEYVVDKIAKILGTQVAEINPWNRNQWISGGGERSSSSTIMSFSPTTLDAGVDDLLTIDGSNFGGSQGTLFFRNANSTNINSYIGCPSTNIDSWSSTQITVRVPNGAGTGQFIVRPSSGADQYSGDQLTVYYNVSSFNGTPNATFVRYAAPTSAGEVEYRYNTTFANNADAAASFDRAMQTWICTSGINWVKGANTSADAAANDNISVIRWADGDINYPTVGQYNGFFFVQTGAYTEWCADEFDIMFLDEGDGVTWNYGPGDPASGETDFESVAVHELGHAMILGHVSDSDEIMYPQSSGVNREPGPSSVDGAEFSMPKHQSTPTSCSSYFALTELADIEVSNTNSSGDGSLAQALSDVCPDSGISFSSALNGSTIFTNGSPFLVDKNMTITGPGVNLLTLSGNNTTRIFTIEPDISFELKDIKLINGKSTINGGAFFNQGTTTLENVTLENNTQGSTQKAFSNQAGKHVIMKGDVDIKE